MFGGILHSLIGGPPIPEAVWRALEDDKLIFYCGAGVSKGAGLPLFDELTMDVRKRVGAIQKEGLVQAAFDNEAYDRVFTLLEEDGRRSVVRNCCGAGIAFNQVEQNSGRCPLSWLLTTTEWPMVIL